MAFKTMCTKTSTFKRRVDAYTLVEMMVALGLFSISALALATIFMFSIKSFASMANYAELDRENRAAMDIITRDLRQARAVLGYTTNSTGNTLSIIDETGNKVTYSFNFAKQEFRRTSYWTSQVLLTNCN